MSVYICQNIKIIGLPYCIEMLGSKDIFRILYSIFNNFDYLLAFVMHIILNISSHVALIIHTQIDILIVIILKMRKWGSKMLSNRLAWDVIVSKLL